VEHDPSKLAEEFVTHTRERGWMFQPHVVKQADQSGNGGKFEL
jgi:hypothetical protein